MQIKSDQSANQEKIRNPSNPEDKMCASEVSFEDVFEEQKEPVDIIKQDVEMKDHPKADNSLEILSRVKHDDLYISPIAFKQEFERVLCQMDRQLNESNKYSIKFSQNKFFTQNFCFQHKKIYGYDWNTNQRGPQSFQDNTKIYMPKRSSNYIGGLCILDEFKRHQIQSNTSLSSPQNQHG